MFLFKPLRSFRLFCSHFVSLCGNFKSLNGAFVSFLTVFFINFTKKISLCFLRGSHFESPCGLFASLCVCCVSVLSFSISLRSFWVSVVFLCLPLVDLMLPVIFLHLLFTHFASPRRCFCLFVVILHFCLAIFVSLRVTLLRLLRSVSLIASNMNYYVCILYYCVLCLCFLTQGTSGVNSPGSSTHIKPQQREQLPVSFISFPSSLGSTGSSGLRV